MMNSFILHEQEFQEKVFEHFNELKLLLQNSLVVKANSGSDELMDTADLVIYLKLDRRTIYSYRKRGLQFTKTNGRLFYWKSQIDQYFGKSIN